MLEWLIWVQFLAYIVPLVISPGPGNTTFAALGSQYGMNKSLPFWFGFELGDLFLCILYAFGLGSLIHLSPMIEISLKWAGIAFLFYLAWTFAHSAFHRKKGNEKQAKPILGIYDGFLSVCLNPKIHTMLLALFSQFGAFNLFGQIIQLTAGFMIISIISHGIWIVGGQILLSQFHSSTAQCIINLIFSASIAFSAILMI